MNPGSVSTAGSCPRLPAVHQVKAAQQGLDDGHGPAGGAGAIRDHVGVEKPSQMRTTA